MQGLPKFARILFYAAIAVSVISYGAVYRLPFMVVVFFACVSLAFAALTPVAKPETGKIYRYGLVLVLLMAGLLVFQSIPVPRFLADPVWDEAGELLGFTFAAISVEPATTIGSILPLTLPFVIFLAALALFQSDRSAFNLWNYLARLGVLVAAFSVVQFTMYPDWLLGRPKEHYLDSLTGTFVNRNTAATFFGLASLVVFGCLLKDLRSLRDRKIHLLSAWRPRQFNNGRLDLRVHLFVWTIGLIITLLALFLTQSRGGITATSIAFAVATGLVIQFEMTNRRPAWQRLTAISGGVGAVLFVVIVFGGRALLRLEEKGLEDDRWCAYRYTIDAILDHPILGAGFGTFESLFPAYRVGACAPGGQWSMAHNSYLEAYLGLGLPFLFILGFCTLVLLAIMRTGFKYRRRYRLIPAIGLAMLLLVGVHSFVDFSLQIPAITVYFAAAMGAMTTISLGRRGY